MGIESQHDFASKDKQEVYVPDEQKYKDAHAYVQEIHEIEAGQQTALNIENELFSAYGTTEKTQSKYPAKKEIQIQGSGKGKIIHVGQSHHRPELDTDMYQTVAVEDEIINYQRHIFQYLETENIQTVFSEMPNLKEAMGMLNDEMVSIVDKYGIQAVEDAILHKQSPAWADIRQVLWKYGADLLYGWMNSDTVTLNPTYPSEAIYDQIKNQIDNPDPAWVEDLYRMDVREALAAAAVREHMCANPDDRVALVYGSNHDFTSALTESNVDEQRTLEKVTFPDIDTLIDEKVGPAIDAISEVRTRAKIKEMEAEIVNLKKQLDETYWPPTVDLIEKTIKMSEEIIAILQSRLPKVISIEDLEIVVAPPDTTKQK